MTNEDKKLIDEVLEEIKKDRIGLILSTMSNIQVGAIMCGDSFDYEYKKSLVMNWGSGVRRLMDWALEQQKTLEVCKENPEEIPDMLIM